MVDIPLNKAKYTKSHAHEKYILIYLYLFTLSKTGKMRHKVIFYVYKTYLNSQLYSSIKNAIKSILIDYLFINSEKTDLYNFKVHVESEKHASLCLNMQLCM